MNSDQLRKARSYIDWMRKNRRQSAASRMEAIMDETDAYCRTHPERLTHSQVFSHAREIANAGRRVHT